MLLIWLPYILLNGYAHFELGLGGDPFNKNSLFNFLGNLLLINGMGTTPTLSWNYAAWSISVAFFTYLVFLTFIGTLSYSIYMTHALVFIVIDNLAEYVLRMPTSEIYRAGMGWLQVFKTLYASLINLIVLA